MTLDSQATTTGNAVVLKDAALGTHEHRSESSSKKAKEGHSKTKDTVAGAVRLALDVTESLSDGVPFLPGAVKALKTVVEAYEVR